MVSIRLSYTTTVPSVNKSYQCCLDQLFLLKTQTTATTDFRTKPASNKLSQPFFFKK